MFLYIADTLSRMQLSNPGKTSMIPEAEMNIYFQLIDSIVDSLPVSDAKVIEIRESQDD